MNIIARVKRWLQPPLTDPEQEAETQRLRAEREDRRTPRSTRRSSSRSRSTTSTTRFPAREHLPNHVAQRRLGGMVTKPWSERRRATQQLLMESMGPLSKIAGIRVIPQAPPALPGGGNFPVDFVIASAAEPQRLSEIADQLVAKAFTSGMFIYADADLKFDQPQAEVVFDRDKLRSQGVDLEPGRPGPLGDARRQLRQPLQHPGAELQGDPAGRASGTPHAGSARSRSTSPDRTTSSCRCRRSPR